ncbi:MAG: ComF family protein [Bacteroidota bacterium]
MLIAKKIYKLLIVPFRDIIFPPICFLCGQGLQEKEDRVCNNCWSSFPEVTRSHPVYVELTERFKSGGVVQQFTACYLFEKEGKFQEAVHLLKYRNLKSIGIKLGIEVGKKIMLDSIQERIDYIAPIPLHKLKMRERGYNQSDYICKGISQVVKKECITDLIIRKKYTQSQTKLNLEERKLNVADAFGLNLKHRDLVRGKTILLVDDIITTGATIESVANVLKKNGANIVYAASVGAAK